MVGVADAESSPSNLLFLYVTNDDEIDDPEQLFVRGAREHSPALADNIYIGKHNIQNSWK